MFELLHSAGESSMALVSNPRYSLMRRLPSYRPVKRWSATRMLVVVNVPGSIMDEELLPRWKMKPERDSLSGAFSVPFHALKLGTAAPSGVSKPAPPTQGRTPLSGSRLAWEVAP